MLYFHVFDEIKQKFLVKLVPIGGEQKIHENYDSLFQNPLLVYVSKIKNYICKKYEKGRHFSLEL